MQEEEKKLNKAYDDWLKMDEEAQISEIQARRKAEKSKDEERMIRRKEQEETKEDIELEAM